MVTYFPALSRRATPVCSICIATYNGRHLLEDCLESVLGQLGDITIEIIVHDDASSDGTLEWLRERYPQVELLASDENVGFCVGNNRMVEHARGEYVLLLNNDAALAPDALQTLVAAAGEQTPRGVLTLPQIDWESGTLVDRGCRLDPFYNPVPNLDAERRDVAMVIGACLWIPRSLWIQLGGFPEWLESIGEDLYLCCRARLAGAPVQACATSSYLHRQGASFGGNRADSSRGLSTTYRRRRLSERNKTFTMAVCTPGALLWVLLPLHLAVLSIEGLLLSLLQRDATLWRTVYAPVPRELWKRRTQLATIRRSVQLHTTASTREYFSVFAMRLRKLDLLLRHGTPQFR
jgi:GT2 family glycosyltransferase